MTFTPLTDDERADMLSAIGVSSVTELFTDVPERHRYPPVELGPPRSELDVIRELRALSEMNLDLDHCPSFLGAGAYQHHIPSVVNHVLLRGEFYTAYTPYQPEVSQGTLQAIFEYQSMICALTGMDVANASHYDGATALAEGVLMAYNVLRGKRRKAILSLAIHPEYRQVVRTYVQGMEIDVVSDGNPGSDLETLLASLDEDTFCVGIQNPNFFGELQSETALQTLVDAVHAKGALVIVVSYPIALGLVAPPGSYGADIVLGEAQPLGNALNFGGPYLGYFACREQHVRKMAGRLVGQTVDVDGRRGYVLTLSTREQHIRRERATSNICTNQSLCALASAVYMSTMGRQGLSQVAKQCYHKAHYLAAEIDKLDGYRLIANKPFFNEFVIECPKTVRDINAELVRQSMIGGLDLGRFYQGMEKHMLVCATEVHTKKMLDTFVRALVQVRGTT